jgi:hypothetical protein
MLRRLFTVLSALSLPLCVAVLVLWVRSLLQLDQVKLGPADRFTALRSERGDLAILRGSYTPDGRLLLRDKVVRVPYLGVAVLAAVLPAAWLLQAQWERLRQRKEQGLCRVCGYDLRATPGRCPECGSPPQR